MKIRNGFRIAGLIMSFTLFTATLYAQGNNKIASRELRTKGHFVVEKASAVIVDTTKYPGPHVLLSITGSGGC
jgi:hypothetical protein